jgi:hypothetical protein
MDLGAYWQENRRFVLSVGAGVVVFLIGFAIESSLFQGKINAAQRAIQLNKNQLKELQFSAKDLAEVEGENAALRAALEELVEAARFRPRPEFVPDPAAGSSANHYLRTLSRVREELLTRANRASLTLDSSLGMPELSPTAEREILRYLEALDLVESVADLAIRARADGIDKIQVRLDPGHASRQGVGAIERTRVQMTLVGSSLALTRVLAWTQRPAAGGRVLPIDKLEMTTARGRKDQVRLDVTFVLARVKELEPPPEKSGTVKS